MKSAILAFILVLFLLPIVGCGDGWLLRLPVQSPFYKAEEEIKKPRLQDKIMNKSAVKQVFERSGWLMSVLILGGVAGIVLALWVHMKEAIFLTIGCWTGAALLVTLAGWAHIVGILMLVAGLILLVIMLVRWKQIADSAIDYADGLKKHVSPTNKEKVNVVAERVQPKAVKKYVLQRRKLTALVKPPAPVKPPATY